MIRRLLLFALMLVLTVVLLGCNESEMPSRGSIQTPSEEAITQEKAEKIIGLVQNYPFEGGTIKCIWDDMTSETSIQEWIAFRPAGYNRSEIYCVQLKFEDSVEHNNYQIMVQWIVDLETGIMRDIYYESNGAVTDKINVLSILESMK